MLADKEKSGRSPEMWENALSPNVWGPGTAGRAITASPVIMERKDPTKFPN